MILVVFEGKEREVDIFNALKQLFFSDEEVIVEFTYNTGFHTLYKNLIENDMSLFRVLQEASRKRFAQLEILDAQCREYVQSDPCCVSILNSFPIFLYEYFK